MSLIMTLFETLCSGSNIHGKSPKKKKVTVSTALVYQLEHFQCNTKFINLFCFFMSKQNKNLFFIGFKSSILKFSLKKYY